MTEILMFEPRRERAELLRTCIKALFLCKKRSYTMSTVFTPNDTLKTLVNNFFKYDIVLINLDNEDDARKIAQSIRKKNILTTIAFLGGDYEKLCELLPLRPSAIISYTAVKESVMQTLSILCDEQGGYKEQFKNNQYFLLRNRDELERIRYENIDFFESSNRKIYLHTNESQRVYGFNAKIDDVAKKIAVPSFIRCHQSYLVNLANVRRVDKTARQFIMFSGNTADISKRNISEVAAHFEKYAAIR